MKTLNSQGPERWVAEPKGPCPGQGAGKLCPLTADGALCVSSTWLFLSFVLSNKRVNSRVFS